MVTHRDDPVLLLNQDLMGEHQAIVHYLTHAWTVVRQWGGSIEAIARDEMRHFKWLAHAIVALGGVPDLTPPDLLPVFSGMEALDYDIDAEEQAISQYLAHQREIADDRVQALIARIVVDERDHRRQFLAMRADAAETDAEPARAIEHHGADRRFQSVLSCQYQAILHALMQSFLASHAKEVGMDAEDRAVDEMKHMSWMAEALDELGGMPRFKLPENGATDEPALYAALGQWARSEMPALVPLIDRMADHENYHRMTSPVPGWTVGSGTEGGWS